MNKSFWMLAILAGISTLALLACGDEEKKSAPMAIISNDSLVKRGYYLVNATGCDDCHSPKKMGPAGPEVDMDLRFSGHPAAMPLGKADTEVMKNGWMLFNMNGTAYVGPWGTSYAANLTSDETGIGSWTEEQFFRAIREGKSKGLKEGRDLLPPMPWPVYRNLSDVDIKSIYTYLKSTKPVANRVPGPTPLGL